eukprot:1320887-Alexandrium_andersonii.AAC.1
MSSTKVGLALPVPWATLTVIGSYAMARKSGLGVPPTPMLRSSMRAAPRPFAPGAATARPVARAI